MRLPFILTFLAIVYVSAAFTSELRERRHFGKEDLTEYDNALCVGEACAHHRQKRGTIISAIIALSKVAWAGAKITLKIGHHGLLVTSLALTITSAASGGCSYFPSICEDRDEIERLEPECINLAQQLMTKYENASADYEILREVTLNNIVIDNILQGIAEQVDSVFNMSVEVDNILAKDINNTDLLGKYTAEEIVNILVQPVEYRLKNLEEMIKKTSEEGFRTVGEHVGIALGIEAISAGFSKFFKSYQTTSALAGAGATIGTKLKLTFNSLWTKTSSFFTNFRTNMKTILNNKLSTLKAKVSNPVGTVKSYFKGINAAHTFVNGMGAAAGAIMIYLDTKNWEVVRDQLRAAAANYRAYKSDLEAQLALSQNQTETVAEVKTEAIATFNNIVASLSSGINTTIYDDTALFQNLQSGVLPNEVVTLLNKEQATNDNILIKQANVVKIVNDSKFHLENYRGWVKALNMIVTAAYSGFSSGTPVLKILESVTLGFQYQDAVVKQFSSLISLESLICVLTFILPTSDSYRSFPLASIRETCAQGNPSSLSTAYVTEHAALAIDYLATENVNKQKAVVQASAGNCSNLFDPPQCSESVTDISTVISAFFTEDPVLDSSMEPTLKELVYRIAALFPSDTTFAFISLAEFRTRNDITDTEFNAMLLAARRGQFECGMDVYAACSSG